MVLQEKTVRVDKWEITYFVVGSGPPLLFLHGMGISPLQYALFLRTLAASYTVYAPRMFGFLAPHPSTVEEAAQVVSAFERTLHIKPVVVGHSTGAAVQFALHARGVAINPPASSDPHRFERIFYVRIAQALVGVRGRRTASAMCVALPRATYQLLMHNKNTRNFGRDLVATARTAPENCVVLRCEHDEFFGKGPGIIVANRSHNWPLTHGDEAGRAVLRRLRRISRS